MCTSVFFFLRVMCDILRSDPRGRLVVGAVSALTS